MNKLTSGLITICLIFAASPRVLAEISILNFNPLLVVETKPLNQDLVLFIGGMGETPPMYTATMEAVIDMGFNVAFLNQRTEEIGFRGPVSLLPEDLNHALLKLKSGFARRSIFIVGQSMVWATLEYWRIHPKYRSAREVLNIAGTVVSNPALEFDRFIDPHMTGDIMGIDDEALIKLYLTLEKNGVWHKVLIGERHASLVKAFRSWLARVRSVPVRAEGRFSTNIILVDQDPNLNPLLIDEWISQLRSSHNPFELHTTTANRSKFTHNLWTDPDPEHSPPFKVLSQILKDAIPHSGFRNLITSCGRTIRHVAKVSPAPLSKVVDK